MRDDDFSVSFFTDFKSLRCSTVIFEREKIRYEFMEGITLFVNKCRKQIVVFF
jgi:hypothetical protein